MGHDRNGGVRLCPFFDLELWADPLPRPVGAGEGSPALYFVCKRLSSFALEVQSQVSGQEDRGGNPRFLGAGCAGTRIADAPGRPQLTFGGVSWRSGWKSKTSAKNKKGCEVKGKCAEAKDRRLQCRGEGDRGSAGASDAEVYKKTKIPLRTMGLRIGEGGEYSEQWDGHAMIKPKCTRISLGSLKLGKDRIALKSNRVTLKCMIETEEYGDLRLKIDSYSSSYSILVTERQEQLFKELSSKQQ